MNTNTLNALLASQVYVNPDRIAVTYYNKSISYQELDLQSNQLANYLILQGVKSNSYVPIILERSFEMIVAIVATLKCGASYVPIDPAYPKERINYILNDISASFIIAAHQNTYELNASIICLKHDAAMIAIQNTDLPSVTIQGQDTAYIIYTSGSTGKPKGVEITHAAVNNFIAEQGKYYGVEATDRILLFSSFAFDASVEQIFLALSTGACLILLSEDLLLDTEKFTNYVTAQKINHLDVTPGFLENLNPVKFKNLKRIIVGGDVCPISLYLKWQFSGTFYNVYGPTEGTVTATALKCDANNTIYSPSLPIGKPLKGTTVFILDEAKELVTTGSKGEIYLGGNHLAKGYLNNQKLTDVNFTSAPSIHQTRLYRTGDMGRWLEDGNIEYLGRIDDQVKIRGYRVELGEIENVLLDIPYVKQCVVKINSSSEKQLVAFIVGKPGFNKIAAENYLASALPEFMIPRIWVNLSQMPLTVNGKIDKKALIIPDYSDLLQNPYVAPKNDQEKRISSIWKEVLAVKRVGINDNFFDLGGDSLLSQKLIIALAAQKFILPITKLYQYPTIAGVLKYLNKSSESVRQKNHQHQTGDRDIAVIGMAGRFPGAETISALWQLLCKGEETTTFFTDEELDEHIPDQIKNDLLYIKARGVIKDTMLFDPDFFGINKKLAELMDPQQRIFLEIAYEVLEKTGHLPSKADHKTGVFAGCGPNLYYENNVLAHPDKIETMGKLQVTTVNDKDYIASRTAYHLNLKGPAININSACSTSLLAILEAVNSLRAMQCDVAIAGGASINSCANSGHIYQEGSILSKDGHCRPFDDDSTGTVFSDGAGVVLLKRLEDAKADGDQIYAVIKGVGVSNDGNDKASFTAPSTEGQADAVLAAIADADVESSDISYVETHGTGTPIGDPIEFEGLVQAFGQQNIKQYCAIGSIKSNFGHLTEAAGVASFIKTCLSLHHKKLVPSIGFNTPNKHIDFDNSPFYVNNHLQNWNAETRLAGVSSFGVGGTNVHVVLEGYENTMQTPVTKRAHELISWSAKSMESLKDYGSKLEDFIQLHPAVLAEDLAYSLHQSQADFNYRAFGIVNTMSNLAEEMANQKQSFAITHQLHQKANKLVFLFPGQGAQYLNMGASLYKQEAVYKDAIDECAELLKEIIHLDIKSIIFSANNEPKTLNDTQYAQPAIFCTEYALAKLWMSWGCKADIFCGHSVGEYVAAHLAGVFSLNDALILVALRGKLISKLPGGGMLSVRIKNTEIADLLPEDLSIAAENTKNLFVISGNDQSLSIFKKKLDNLGMPSKLLATSHAFHSVMMDPVLPDFKKLVESINLQKPKVPIVSSVTGKLLTNEQALDVNYWTNHLRNTVKFSTAITYIINHHDPLFLEVGPGEALSVFTKQILLEHAHKGIVISSMMSSAVETQKIIHSVGALVCAGFPINWEQYYSDQQRNFVELPTYAFNKKKFWVEPAQPAIANNNTSKSITKANTPNNQAQMKRNVLINQVKTVLELSSGIEFDGIDLCKNFLEIGFDSLLLTQVATSLKKEFKVPITFRQLNEECSSIDALVNYLAPLIVTDPVVTDVIQASPISSQPVVPAQENIALALLSAQLELIAKQIQLITNTQNNPIAAPVNIVQNTTQTNPVKDLTPLAALSKEEQNEVRKPFGATPKIEFTKTALSEKQQQFLSDLIKRYNKKTAKSKASTAESRGFMADPRVVNGFKPAIKDLIYPIIVKKSDGSKLWDLDGNQYIDALNGFGSNMLGYQPDFIKEALHYQIEKGFEVGPQHELAAEVSRLVCDFTDFDRTGLCSTGSEAVMGCIRLARTVTARSLIVAFTGSYHGIFDEVLVRGTKKMKSFPAAAGIMPEAVENILVLDYGTDETLAIIKDRASEIAGVLVEPIQSRRPEFVPISFLKQLRQITSENGVALIFDEVITGFRMHPGGAQALLGVKADIAAYGKVVGAGIPIGVIAGTRTFMDALDGGTWNYGDDSIPEVGITYFAGTFVRHPLALASAKASLIYMKEQGPSLQQKLNDKGNFISKSLNREIAFRKLPMQVVNFGSLWKLKMEPEMIYSELLFVLMREKGIHILDGFPCFITEATSYPDIDKMIIAFTTSIDEMIAKGFFPNTHNQSQKLLNYNPHAVVIDNNQPPISGARLGKDRFGNPAWFIEDPENDQMFLQVQTN
ncbi:polyketide synthase [Pedobacter sp. Leaf250]|uniref:polyketide synthase n=1 Tax=Pedobacter sp. Leaf250 TaxID=2876559 RepID=UPI001E65A5C9|nr:polyketide synthase [Pedobacter sp. Leaf250]